VRLVKSQHYDRSNKISSKQSKQMDPVLPAREGRTPKHVRPSAHEERLAWRSARPHIYSPPPTCYGACGVAALSASSQDKTLPGMRLLHARLPGTSFLAQKPLLGWTAPPPPPASQPFDTTSLLPSSHPASVISLSLLCLSVARAPHPSQSSTPQSQYNHRAWAQHDTPLDGTRPDVSHICSVSVYAAPQHG
jgi:hypothetical protein